MPIAHGYPSTATIKRAERGELLLGGCEVEARCQLSDALVVTARTCASSPVRRSETCLHPRDLFFRSSMSPSKGLRDPVEVFRMSDSEI